MVPDAVRPPQSGLDPTRVGGHERAGRRRGDGVAFDLPPTWAVDPPDLRAVVVVMNTVGYR